MLQTNEMRKIILLAVILFVAAITVTVLYFSGIKLPGQNTDNVIKQIPDDAALVFEFKNDPEFFELFKDSPLFTSFIGQKKANELQYLHRLLVKKSNLTAAFSNRSFYISLHPEMGSGNIEMLLTTNAEGIVDFQKLLETLVEQTNGALELEYVGNKTIQKITFPELKEVFYLSENAQVLAGSFSKVLLMKFLDERLENKISNLTQLPDQQNKNSIANLYVNFQQFPILFKQLFKNQHDDFFRFLSGFPATATLSLNYKSDALLFNGYTRTDTTAAAYLQVFLKLQPEKTTINTIYPANTASAISFAYSLPAGFLKRLDKWQIQKHQQVKAKILFNQIRKETGVDIQSAFRKQLGKEFAVLTTAEDEKIALIKLKNGSELEPFLRNISENPDSSQNRLKYQNLPYYLLGEPFLNFKQPYFTVIDNYLLLANSQTSLNRYLENYHQQHFLSENLQYYNFASLLAEQSTITFFIHLPNAYSILSSALQPAFAKPFSDKNAAWKNYFAAALQLSASENNFYTNFYLQQNKDTTVKRNTVPL